MDALPAIIVEPEGFDTWDGLITNMISYNVTVVMDSGEKFCGAIQEVFQLDTGDYVLQISEVDDDWDPIGSFRELLIQQMTGIVVH